MLIVIVKQFWYSTTDLTSRYNHSSVRKVSLFFKGQCLRYYHKNKIQVGTVPTIKEMANSLNVMKKCTYGSYSKWGYLIDPIWTLVSFFILLYKTKLLLTIIDKITYKLRPKGRVLSARYYLFGVLWSTSDPSMKNARAAHKYKCEMGASMRTWDIMFAI